MAFNPNATSRRSSGVRPLQKQSFKAAEPVGFMSSLAVLREPKIKKIVLSAQMTTS
jgi:hypothetical protein